MSSNIRVSVILTSFNHEKYLKESIDSVLNQTFTDFELIIWDDASTDGSWEIIQTYTDSRIKTFRNETQQRSIWGINKAISEIAVGEYIAIHHSDDIWELEKLEKQVIYLDEHPDIGFVFTWAKIIDENGYTVPENWFIQENKSQWEWLRELFFMENHLNHPSVLVRKVCYENVGLYRYGFAQSGDAGMWMRLLFEYPIHVLQEVLTLHRQVSDKSNTSADLPETRARLQFEWYNQIQIYRNISDFNTLVKIFPSAEKYRNPQPVDLEWVLAMVALEESGTQPCIQLFGLNLLMEAVSSPVRTGRLKQLYGFDYNTLIALSGKYDGFSLLKLSELQVELQKCKSYLVQTKNQIAEQVVQIADYGQIIVDRDATIAELNMAVVDRATIAELNMAVVDRDARIAATSQSVTELHQQIAEIRNSTAWSIALRITRVGQFLFPSGSKREKGIRLLLQGIRVWRREGARSFFQKTFSRIKHGFQRSLAPFPLKVEKTNSSIDPFVPISAMDVNPVNALVKTIAFYLPQFHPIPENNAWWGEGFTEWTNVTKALPNFEGHYQPHVPGELGYYDLRSLDVQKRQIELAHKYGVYGFCFYYYWFAGKRLLERPIDQYLANPELDLPFCLCWANENWTRRWDGAEHEILIGQTHNEQEYLHFIKDISPNFLDSRYIRVEGKPILLVYRIDILPDPKKAAEIWRNECKRLGIGEIYLVAVQSFGISDPAPYGFDAAVEFPPHYLGGAEVGQDSIELSNPEFKGRFFDYNVAAELMSQKRAAGYTLFKSVMPSWDNTARRQNDSHIFINSTPAAYKFWLIDVVNYTRENLPEDRRLVFINAWNEWAEGTHLEPDNKYGYAFLQATAEAVQGIGDQKFPYPPGWNILFISHDANKGGAQSALLSTLEWFKAHTSISMKVLCLDGGVLLPRFKDLADTIVLSDLLKQPDGQPEVLHEKLLDFCGWKPDLIYGNTVVAGKVYSLLHGLNVPILTHVYELEMSIQRYAADCINDVVKYSTHFMTPSGAVKENLLKNHQVPSDAVTVVFGAIPNEPLSLDELGREKKNKRKILGLDPDKTLIVGCGMGMPFRKGADLFIQSAQKLRAQGRTDFHFYWIGEFRDDESDPGYGVWSDHKTEIRNSDLQDCVTFLGYKENFKEYFQSADIFLLPSREDPLPLVALEAAKFGLPVICFADAGGTPELVGDDAGAVVPFEDLEIMTEKLLALMDDVDLRRGMGSRAREKFLLQFTIDRVMPSALSVCRKTAGRKPSVSVIVPNFNHAKYLPERLESIFDQTFQDFEIILLDDASTDNSVEVIRKYEGYHNLTFIKNQANSGSPFKQWLLGLEKASADIIWIAESDDVCMPEFLERLIPSFIDPDVKLAYANSEVIDGSNQVIGDYSSDMEGYLGALSKTKWMSSYKTDANQEVNDGLGVKNSILNVSSVLIRRFDLSMESKEVLNDMRIAGDWYFYVNAIRDGKIYYDYKKLNGHRRHSESVIAQTVSEGRIRSFFNEIALVHRFIFSSYQLEAGFVEKWERYLFQQLRDFDRSLKRGDLQKYYPFQEMKSLLVQV